MINYHGLFQERQLLLLFSEEHRLHFPPLPRISTLDQCFSLQPCFTSYCKYRISSNSPNANSLQCTMWTYVLITCNLYSIWTCSTYYIGGKTTHCKSILLLLEQADNKNTYQKMQFVYEKTTRLLHNTKTCQKISGKSHHENH